MVKQLMLAAGAALLMAGCQSYQTSGRLCKMPDGKVNTDATPAVFNVGDIDFVSAKSAWFTQTLETGKRRDAIRGIKKNSEDSVGADVRVSVESVSEKDENGFFLFGLLNRVSLGILPFHKTKTTCLRVGLSQDSQPSASFEIEMVNRRRVDVLNIWGAKAWAEDPEAAKGHVVSTGHGFGGANAETVYDVFSKLLNEGMRKTLAGRVAVDDKSVKENSTNRQPSASVVLPQKPIVQPAGIKQPVATKTKPVARTVVPTPVSQPAQVAKKTSGSTVPPVQKPAVEAPKTAVEVAKPVAAPQPTLKDLLKSGVITQEEFDRLAKE